MELNAPVNKNEINLLESGIDIGEKNPTLPATIRIISDKVLYITITEGKYHQIKRMFEAVNNKRHVWNTERLHYFRLMAKVLSEYTFEAVENKVLYLKRISMGELTLDESLSKGQFRRLRADEISYLKSL